jgi:hypothetical protein
MLLPPKTTDDPPAKSVSWFFVPPVPLTNASVIDTIEEPAPAAVDTDAAAP